MNYENNRWLLNKRPSGMPGDECWLLNKEIISDISKNEILIQVDYLSIDP